jgi:hypothetical protein
MRKLTGWTNVNPVTKDGMGQPTVNFCGDQRHRECIKNHACYRMKPQCTVDQLRMVGRKFSWLKVPDVTPDDLIEIDRILRIACGKCRRVEITIRKVPHV